MMNKISLGLSISSFVLILIMFVFGDVNLKFDNEINTNETENLQVDKPILTICDEDHELFSKKTYEWYNSLTDDHKNTFTCEEVTYIENEIHLHLDGHLAEGNFLTGKIHHTHIRDVNGNVVK